MKRLTASKLILILSEGRIEEISIKACEVNRLCEELNNKQIDNELSFYDFENLSCDFPEYIKLTTSEINVTINEHFIKELKRIEYFSNNIIDTEDVIKCWRKEHEREF